MHGIKLLTPIIICALLGACVPASAPLVAERSDNAKMRFSTLNIIAPTKLRGQ